MTESPSTVLGLPAFSRIDPTEVVSSVKAVIEQCKKTITSVVNQSGPFTWDNVCEPLAVSSNAFSLLWSPISHLNSVKNSPELRQAYEQCLPILSEYSTWVGQHEGLYNAYKAIKSSTEFSKLSQAQRKSIDDTLLDFELSGIGLPKDKQKRYGEIVARLSELSSAFSNNVLDATMGWTKLITDKLELSGLPQSALDSAKAAAEAKNLKGWLFTLEYPSYSPVMTYSDNRNLRFEMYQAYNTRASELGPNAGKWDNTAIMTEILALRYELAKLLGFVSYADQSLATKMAESPKQVIDFLTDLAQRARPQGEKELNQLQTFVKQRFDISELEPWDIAYYSEKQKQHLYTIDNEKLRPYFPEDRVISGLFEVVKRLFAISIKERKGVDAWHSDVRFFEIYNQENKLIAGFYLDLYARENKRGGAWMDSCKGKLRLADGRQQLPVAYLTCNFNRPVGNKPALFTHDEVTTLFHEFGHGLHHMLTKIDVNGVAGIDGVPWDAVELPSQFLENWCWQPEALNFISGHYQTGEPLPKDILDKLLAAKNYQAALFILRQLEFGLFDFRLHCEYDSAKGARIAEIRHEVQKQVAVIKQPEWNRMPNSFSHIFAGGYAAGYYSYLWAEELAADAFSRFEQEGIFNPKTGKDFLDCILSQGGSQEPMALFKKFRGRAPQLDALLRHYGINN